MLGIEFPKIDTEFYTPIWVTGLNDKSDDATWLVEGFSARNCDICLKASKWCFIQTDSLQFEKSERNADFFAHLAFVYIIKVVVPPKTVIFNFIPCLVTFLPRYSTVSLVDNLKAGKITGKYCPLRKQGKYFPVSNNQVSRWPISGPALLIRPLTF